MVQPSRGKIAKEKEESAAPARDGPGIRGLIMKKAATLLLVMILLSALMSPARSAPMTLGPDEGIVDLHPGDSAVWKPFGEAGETVYSVSDSSLASISSAGLIQCLAPGEVTFSASLSQEEETMLWVNILPREDGLYLFESQGVFVNGGHRAESGSMPLSRERSLCRNQEDLCFYLDSCLLPALQRIQDPAEAVLTAIANFGRLWTSEKLFFDPAIGGLAEDASADWMYLLMYRKGACVRFSSLFCYLMYLGGAEACQVESNSPGRSHDWNLILHDGYGYNLENHNFLVKPEERLVLPPFSAETASFFASQVYSDAWMYYGKDGKEQVLQGIPELGRNLSEECPLMISERGPDGLYRVRFEVLKRDISHASGMEPR